MMRCWLSVLCACWLAIAGGPGLCAESREALVIGNSKYREVPLKNPRNDAAAMEKSLQKLGFSTRLVNDAEWKGMIESVRAFLADSADADVRLLFYAGHGAQVRGRNFLIPVDAPMDNTEDLTARSLDIAEILDRFARSRRGVSILILDACRNNPASQYQLLSDGRRIKVRAAAAGLAPVRAPAGTIVAFSTSPGNVADDRAGHDNSLYTEHLLKNIATPGLPIEQMFKRVRVGVMKDSREQQLPWEESSLLVDYCMRPGPTGSCPER